MTYISLADQKNRQDERNGAGFSAWVWGSFMLEFVKLFNEP